MEFFIDANSLDIIPLLFLLLVYGYILSKGSEMIADGSELLLLIPSLAGIVGSIVLPVLGAVPDGAIVLFSGLGGTQQEAQAQLSVGVGALAGSTIMLVTIPWALCIFQGRVDIVNGMAYYLGKPKLSQENKFSLTNCGISPRKSIAVNAKIMIATAVSYLIIQGAAFGAKCDLESESDVCQSQQEHWFALVALLTSIAFFVGYMVYNAKYADEEDKEDLIIEIKKQAIESHILSLSAAFESFTKNKGFENLEDDKRFNDALKPFFYKYDVNGDGVIDRSEFRLLLKDVNEDMTQDRFDRFWTEIDTDKSGTIEFKEFSSAMKTFIIKRKEYTSPKSRELVVQTVDAAPHGDDEDEEEEEEEIPEDIASLPPHEQKRRILFRAFGTMGLGTALVLIFSDPMVDVLSALGNQMKISPFYVAFVLAPLASNASELIASIAYANKKTKKTITISLAALEGAACMNNTFCLGIFLCLIFFRGLSWQYSAETIAILFVEFAVFLFAFLLKTAKLWHAIIIISLYPISLLLVWLLENKANLN